MRNHIVYIGLFFFTIVGILATPRLEKLTPNHYDKYRTDDYQYQLHNQRHVQEPQPSTKFSSILPLDLRSINDCKLTDLLLVSDIDGNLHGIERNSGALLWTLPIEEPLVKIQTNSSANSTQPNILWFVEPYQDGSLYYFTPKFGLNKLPTSIKDLVLESPFSLSGDDKIYTGTRKTALYTIDIHTGRIESSFGSEDFCPVPNTHYKINDNQQDNKDTIMIGKTTYELSIYSKQNTNVVWNVTYSQWGPNNIDNDLIMQNQQSLDKLYFTQFYDKSLLGINKDFGTPTWMSKLPSFIVSVFDVFNNLKTSEYVILPHPLKVLNDLQIQIYDNTANNDLVFINKTTNGKEWFAMSFNNYPTLIKSAPFSKYQLDLYKAQNGLPVDTECLRSFNLINGSQSEVDELVNGIHKVYHLSSDTMYQPLSRFDSENYRIQKIGDGRMEVDLLSPRVGDNSETVQNIIDGIKFPESSQTMGSDLIIVDNSREIDALSDTDSDDYSHHNHGRDIPSRFTPSFIRRILEDLSVLLVLFALFVAFSKPNEVKSKLKLILGRERPEIKPEQDKPETAPVLEIAKPIEDVQVRTIEVTNTDDSIEIPETKADVTKKVAMAPKVTMISSNDDIQEMSVRTLDDNSEDENVENKDNSTGVQANETVTKKKRKRGSRGGKRGGKKINKNKADSSDKVSDDGEANENSLNDQDSMKEETQEEIEEVTLATKSLIKLNSIPRLQPIRKLQIEKNLVISDKILGHGSHGTIVFEGTFENRPVAVKRMLLEYFDVASHEVRLLQESDDHPNVVRYFCSQSSETEKFLYIAVELCLGTLADIFEKPKQFKQIKDINDTLYQLASGLDYLHSLKIVHRDLKPQNILVADKKKNPNKIEKLDNNIRLLISDFGLCKKLDYDQSSFRATTQNAALGTSGWRAPELLMNHDLLEISPDTISSVGSASQPDTLTNVSGKRLTKAIDIFSLGCVYYYMLTDGFHPFGDRFMRDANIIHGTSDIELLMVKCPNDKFEATDLIKSMISANPISRPNTTKILHHPLFWNSGKRLEFLLKVSDRFEIEKRDPPSLLLQKLEAHADRVHQGDWHRKMSAEFLENLGKYRKYNTEKLMDLLRAIRNKYHHFNDMSESLQREMNPLPHGFYKYFNDKFPNLLMEVYALVAEELRQEPSFKDFFE
jgi:serine/threonine-protein kinase/endoribonuclease IRE1